MVNGVTTLMPSYVCECDGDMSIACGHSQNSRILIQDGDASSVRTLEACRRPTSPFKTGNEVKEKGMIIPAWGPHGLHIQHIHVGRKKREEGRNF